MGLLRYSKVNMQLRLRTEFGDWLSYSTWPFFFFFRKVAAIIGQEHSITYLKDFGS
jgi:hypothetical protein